MDELTAEEIVELKADLHALETRLTATVETVDDKPVELDQTRMGRVSRIDAMQQQKMAEASLRAHKLRRTQVRAALDAIERAEYGDCKLCEEPVGFRRLKARPETPFCVECQGKRERR